MKPQLEEIISIDINDSHILDVSLSNIYIEPDNKRAKKEMDIVFSI